MQFPNSDAPPIRSMRPARSKPLRCDIQDLEMAGPKPALKIAVEGRTPQRGHKGRAPDCSSDAGPPRGRRESIARLPTFTARFRQRSHLALRVIARLWFDFWVLLGTMSLLMMVLQHRRRSDLGSVETHASNSQACQVLTPRSHRSFTGRMAAGVACHAMLGPHVPRGTQKKLR